MIFSTEAIRQIIAALARIPNDPDRRSTASYGPENIVINEGGPGFF